jgi:hypothetical protein
MIVGPTLFNFVALVQHGAFCGGSSAGYKRSTISVRADYKRRQCLGSLQCVQNLFFYNPNSKNYQLTKYLIPFLMYKKYSFVVFKPC